MAEEEEDDELYSKLYGESAPTETPRKESFRSVTVSKLAISNGDPKEDLYPSPSRDLSAAAPVSEAEQFNIFRPTEDNDDEEELDIKLDERLLEDEEDDLNIKLDESKAGPPSEAIAAADSSLNKYIRSSSRSVHSPATQKTDDAAASKPVSRVAPEPALRPVPPLTYDPSNPGVLPSQVTASGQRVRLPGQTRVTPEEYKEFLGLGHGDIFLLDIDSVVDAPWRVPGADPGDFFNYGMNARAWKEYCARVKQLQLQFAMQKKIPVYDQTARNREGAPVGDTRKRGPPLKPPPDQKATGWQQGSVRDASRPADQNAIPQLVGEVERRRFEGLPMPTMEGLPLPPFHALSHSTDQHQLDSPRKRLRTESS